MANQSFDTTILHPLERPLSSDLNAAQSELHREMRDFLSSFYAGRGSYASAASTQTPGFLADGFLVTPGAPGLAVNLTAGMGFAPNPSPASNIGGIVGLNDLSTYSPVLLSDTQTINLNPAPGAGLARIDLIQVKVNRRLADPTPRDVFNAGTLAFGSAVIDKTLTFDLLGQVGTVLAPAPGTTGISYKVGTTFAYPANDFDSAVALAARPAVDAGYMALAYINVQPGAPAVLATDIVDMRPLLLGPNATCPINIDFNVLGTGSHPAGRIASIIRGQIPPGFKVAITRDAMADHSYLFYAFVGKPIDYRLFGMPFTTQPGQGGFFTNAANGGTFSTGNVDATLKARLADINQTSPTVDVAIGQGFWSIGFSISDLTVSGGYIVAAPLANTQDGSNPYTIAATLTRLP